MHVIFLRKHIGLFTNMHAYACRENIAKKVSYEYKLSTSYAALYISTSRKIICQRLIGACALETRK